MTPFRIQVTFISDAPITLEQSDTIQDVLEDLEFVVTVESVTSTKVEPVGQPPQGWESIDTSSDQEGG